MFEEKAERAVSQDTVGIDLFKENLNASRPSEHPPVKGRGGCFKENLNASKYQNV